MVKNRIALAVILVASFAKVFSSDSASSVPSAAPAAVSSAACSCPLSNPRVGLGLLVAASALDAYEGNAAFQINAQGDHKFVKVGCLKAGIKLADASKDLFHRLTHNELALSANFLGEAKVQVTTGQVGFAAAAYAFLKYAMPVISSLRK